MRLNDLTFLDFRRFTDLQIAEIPASARLIMLAGPNGSGKSSLFDGLKLWHRLHGHSHHSTDETYEAKVGGTPRQWNSRVQVSFHGDPLETAANAKKAIYVRGAFRNESEFSIVGFSRLPSPVDMVNGSRLIDVDSNVSSNYQRLIMDTFYGVFHDDLPEEMTRVELRDRIIGRVQTALSEVFDDLQLMGLGAVGTDSDTGSFTFAKGASTGFLYKNLSAGEKAAFDLVLDAVIKAQYFDDTVWCIDEPEVHLNSRVQAQLLKTLLGILPPKCQLVLASHSIGFMSAAWAMAKERPDEVAFIDMGGHDFDQPVRITPLRPSRDFWARTLDVALGDLASLVAPSHIVLCEGRPPTSNSDTGSEFDASCYRKIFAQEFPDVDFLSVGNSHDVQFGALATGRAIQTLSAGTTTTQLIDGDLLSDTEVEERQARGVRVLSRRHIEAYLLDDEILTILCASEGQPEAAPGLLAAKAKHVQDLPGRGKDADDIKSAAGLIQVDIRRQLQLGRRAGSNWQTLAKDLLAPLLQPGTTTYVTLKKDVFGSS